MNKLPLLGLPLLLASCFMNRGQINEPYDPELIAQLVPGQSTAGDVVALLGGPNDVVQLGRRSAYRYEHLQIKKTGFTVILVTFLNEDTRSDRIWVFFDEDEILSHIGTSFEAGNTRWAMPWQKVHDYEAQSGESEPDTEAPPGEATPSDEPQGEAAGS